MLLTTLEIARLRAETLCAEKTIKNWARDPDSVAGASRARLDGAAARLGLERPSPSRPPKPSP